MVSYNQHVELANFVLAKQIQSSRLNKREIPIPEYYYSPRHHCETPLPQDIWSCSSTYFSKGWGAISSSPFLPNRLKIFPFVSSQINIRHPNNIMQWSTKPCFKYFHWPISISHCPKHKDSRLSSRQGSYPASWRIRYLLIYSGNLGLNSQQRLGRLDSLWPDGLLPLSAGKWKWG